MRPLLFNLGAGDELAADLAARLGAERGSLAQRRFPDGETYLRFESECGGRTVAIACSLDRPDDKVVSLLLAAATLRDLGAVRVGLIAPYLAYMRQDARFRPGEGITARYFARLLSAHFDWLATVDPHLHRIHSLDEIYSIPTGVARAAPALAGWIREHVEEPLLIGPDSESEQWVADVAARAEAPYLVAAKERAGDRDVTVAVPRLERYRGRTPVLVDDIVSTGHTLVATIEHLVRVRCPAPVCVAVHAVFVRGAAELLRDAGAARVITSNTIAHPTSAVDIGEPLAAVVRDLLDEST